MDAEERMMRVLVTAATKYGATAEIAQVIGEVLGEHGLEARPPGQSGPSGSGACPLPWMSGEPAVQASPERGDQQRHQEHSDPDRV